MLPPCDPTILETNPKFKRLYQNLTTTLLNPDGSTRANDAQPARKAVLEDLKSCRMRHAKREIKRDVLKRLAFGDGDGDGGVPDEYRDSIAMITLYLESSPDRIDLGPNRTEADTTLSLLAPDIDTFYTSIPTWISNFSATLSSTVSDLRTIATGPATASETPDSRPRLRSRQASKLEPLLSAKLNERVLALSETQLSELPAARREIAALAAGVLAARAQVLERTVVILERAKHGSLARATKAKAEHLATVAEGVEGKLTVMKYDISNEIYTPETIAALNRYRQHLLDTRERLEERRVLAVEELKEYEVVDSKGKRQPGRVFSGPMVEVARRYGELIGEVERVRMEMRGYG